MTQAITIRPYTQAALGAIHPARYCGNCVHLRSDVCPIQHPHGVCGRHGWDLLDENIARCTGHQTDGEKIVGLHRPEKAMNAPTDSGASAAYLDAVADVLRLKEAGDTSSPEFVYALCEMVESAPQSYFDGLEAMQAGAAAKWKEWAVDHRAWLLDQQDRLAYPDFFAALADLRAIIDQHGESATHEPEHFGIFIRLFESAPPRYRAVAEEILAPCIPKATHCEENGNSLFSARQIADQLGVPLQKVEADIERFFGPQRLHSGATHRIQ